MTEKNKKIVTAHLKNLEDLLTDKISELHKAQGFQTERHAFIYYREIVWSIKELI